MHFADASADRMLADMQHTQCEPHTPHTRRDTARSAGVALMLASGSCNQLGAAVGALAFPVLGPTGVVAVRQWIAGAVLLAVGRPRLRSFTGRQWRPVLLLAAAFATMNLSLYSAVDRIGLGLAVTLEFLGPLAVALLSSRRAPDLVCGAVAAVGVLALTRPQPSTDYAGIALALLAATCWACYILLNRTVGHRLPGAEGSAAAAGVSALLYLPVGITLLVVHPPTLAALACAATAGMLSSAVPMLTDMLALRRVPAHFFGIFMSVNPVLAAGAGLLVLGQSLQWSQWLGIAAIVTANTASVLLSRPRTTQTAVQRGSAEGTTAPTCPCGPLPTGDRRDRENSAST
ncbi:transporter, EamA family [Saccharopolyspora erythraea NRRL 2338]|uniref:Transporter, EamA family n=3 Tax=Saccharopolyspora erythraea TaxID=1836 RepID=A4FFZ5_SACEN|nr:membrane protein [Saccharopolyspora erythraea D]CAM02970.1 transporter, EamA family [Saccharopolyspora erythraea NRRL 2338]